MQSRPSPKALLAGLLSTLALACAPPGTDLTRSSGDTTMVGPPPGSAAAGGALLDPMAGAVDVPANLAAVIVRFAGPVTWGEAGIRVCDGDGGPVASSAPVDVSCDGGTCYRTE